METEQPSGDSDAGLLERLGNALVPDVGTSEPETQAVEASAEAEAPAQETDEQPEAEADDGFVELELEEGEKYRVPQKLKDSFLRQSDYTRKTQEVATLQKQAQAVIEQQQLKAQFDNFTAEDQQKLNTVRAQIAQYKQVDWANLPIEDHFKYRAVLDQLKDQAQELEAGLKGKQQQFEQMLNGRRAQAAQQAYEYIGQHVKGFAPDSQVEREVAQAAVKHGMPVEAFAQIALMYPGFAVLAHKAKQYDELQSAKTTAVKAVQKAPPIIKPGAVTSTNTQAQQRYQKTRTQLKKSGDFKDAAALLLQRMK